MQRREKYFAKLDVLFRESYPMLTETLRECLSDSPEDRPSTVMLLSKVEELKSQIEGKYGLPALNIANILLTKEMTQKDKMIKELKVKVL